MSKSLLGKLTTMSYGFFIGLALTWFLVSFFVGGYVNYISLLTFVLFSAQAYFKIRMANLALGIILMPASIFWGLQFVWMGAKTGFDLFTNIMVALSAVSFALSIVLVFGYLKMSFDHSDKPQSPKIPQSTDAPNEDVTVIE
jgi:ethanolamine transporter EutH